MINLFKTKSNKQELEYLEIHLVDHCNLNCKGCGHFSPLAKEWYLSIESYKADLKRLKTKISNIKQIRLLGGEPLLHPSINKFIEITRKTYKLSRIAIVTNGILLSKLDQTTTDIIKKHSIEIHITTYPKTKNKINTYLEMLDKEKIYYEITNTEVFQKYISKNNKRNPEESFKACRKKYFCPSLREGKIYQCSGLAQTFILFENFNINFSQAEYYDIYNNSFSYESLINFVNTPNSFCSHCFFESSSYNWDLSNYDESEWFE